ncbi:MAG: hypothetical protein A3I77_04575 [Gammaproteobacteria bacterium RIFCSPLOWO2_02_FULL_42_14]|nr:MAG: hypothetical protein A3B71_05875 [Gammaproteobacteria bacterium RIFCSPHIGHO2_02_FULL_42_43]OGT28902.1 MAG: hypothetical protein A2624_04925 [Gammaproteobacteria bacterium RIFCSPHIGHO2_01_FULL_42_8]OGT51517.1 MAG: hypothetical protein A3E54_05640 [Gammaproteobacteria bacterium RIFCSPHIGHO2_12_FULL_41_25]OGT62218.1 MAG: hypothetical protein A3I77_04575 [Gammaproteobacteria bacterium RIFCSPLOWO2_02_FULL_42_14]OGT85891.1 MAG: hypothetical protein A3G86_04265 [Gammaproteobacteria bacterium R
MLSSVLHSQQAIWVNIEIMRTFVRLRKMIDSHQELRQKIENLEKKYDKNFRMVFEAIHQLINLPASKNNRTIGFI